MLTSQQLVKYYQNAVKEHWGYVWSLNGELYTRAMAERYHANKRSTSKYRDPSTYWLIDCEKWIGKMAADCSGGIIGALRTVNPKYSDKDANTLYAQCTKKGPISTIHEVPGLCVWLKDHIGIYEGNGYILEFKNTEEGASRTHISERNFTNWGYLRDVQYSGEEKSMPKIVKITNPIVYDADVQLLQNALNKLGYDCGTADGKAGAKTMNGIEAFCKAHISSDPGTSGPPINIPDPIMSLSVGEKVYQMKFEEV